MIADHQIREKIALYLGNKLSLDSFEDWLVERSWNMHRDSDAQSQELASAVELRLAELSSGHLDEAALRAELLPFVTKYVVPVSLSGAMVPWLSLSSSNIAIEPVVFQVVFPGKQIRPEAPLFAGTSHEVVYGSA